LKKQNNKTTTKNKTINSKQLLTESTGCCATIALEFCFKSLKFASKKVSFTSTLNGNLFRMCHLLTWAMG
jgi:hypothetical protein